MSEVAKTASAVRGRDLRKTFLRESGEPVVALDGISLEVRHGTLTALVGPDGAGKTTLIRLMTGLMTADSGELSVLGIDVRAAPQRIQERIGYMPQKFGLYEDLSVEENLDLYADLHGVSLSERRERYPRLLEMTALGAFTRRLAGRLSGGMKQKLGLACTLVRAPELLILDEPTVGVDPLSRRELWEIVRQLVHEQALTVLVSTSYLDEAERSDQAIVLHHGQMLAHGRPADVSGLAKGRTYLAEPPLGFKASSFQARLLDDPKILDAVPESGRVRVVMQTEAVEEGEAGREASALSGAAILPAKPRFEDGFMILLRQRGLGTGTFKLDGETRETTAREEKSHGEVVVEVRDLVRRFGAFTAVDHVHFEVRRGEIFGLLGPNGAGKTTTFRMLCGLLPASGGSLRVAGRDLRRARASAREKIGYVAQKFSLYGQLSVAENLEFFASAYNLRGERRRQRIDWALTEFDLASFKNLPSGQLPGGYKQRLAMAAALLHEPETLFLDEPTSGADPLARREFWRRIVALAERGVTVIVTTHFMAEAEYCDRVAIMDAGRVLAEGAPADIRRRARVEGKEPTMEEAFIAVVEDARQAAGANGAAA